MQWRDVAQEIPGPAQTPSEFSSEPVHAAQLLSPDSASYSQRQEASSSSLHLHLSNLRQLLTLVVQVRRQEQALSSALHAPNEFYVNYVLYQCCDIVNSILLRIFNALQMQ